jgi:hypothetical protein
VSSSVLEILVVDPDQHRVREGSLDLRRCGDSQRGALKRRRGQALVLGTLIPGEG